MKYNFDFLSDAWLLIVVENDKDTESQGNQFSTHYLSKMKKIEELNAIINILKSGLLLSLYEHDGYKNVLSQINYKFVSNEKLKSFIRNRETEFNILKANIESFKKSLGNKDYNFYDELAKVLKVFPGFNVKNCTVKMWNSIIKNMNDVKYK